MSLIQGYFHRNFAKSQESSEFSTDFFANASISAIFSILRGSATVREVGRIIGEKGEKHQISRRIRTNQLQQEENERQDARDAKWKTPRLFAFPGVFCLALLASWR
jgi:hypothetical protein